MTPRQHYKAQILAGFCANPAIFAPNQNSGWGLVNATDNDLVGYASSLADKMCEEDAMADSAARAKGEAKGE